MDYTWIVSTPSSSSGWGGGLLTSVVVVVVVVMVGCCWTDFLLLFLSHFFFLSLLVLNSSLNLAPGKRFNVHVISGRLSLVSLVGFVGGPRSREMNVWLSLLLRCIVVKATQVLESGLVAELVLVLSLHHGWSLCPQHFDSLEDVHRPFVTHPLQDNTQSDEDTCPPHASTAVNADWSVLAKLLLGFVHLANEIDEALPRFGDALLWPISELELTHRS